MRQSIDIQSDRMATAMLRAADYHPPHPGASHAASMTIAVSRDLGTPAELISREVGARLQWPVFDHELLERIAAELHVRVELVEAIDERHLSWLEESFQQLALPAAIRENRYLRHLLQTIGALAAHGRCIIVGRGAAYVLPPSRTLRVRVVAPREYRVAWLRRQSHVTAAEAEQLLAASDRVRTAFVKEHFRKDPADPLHYDLVINCDRLSVADGARLVLDSLALRQADAARRTDSTLPAPRSA